MHLLKITMAVEKTTKDNPIFKSKTFLQDVVSFNIMLLIIQHKDTVIYTNNIDFVIAHSPDQNSLWVWTISDIPAASQTEMWECVRSMCGEEPMRIFIKSVLTHSPTLDIKASSAMFAYQCNNLVPISFAHGSIRCATIEDLYVMANLIETCEDLDKDAAIAKADFYLKNHTPYLWTDNGDSTVAMAVIKDSEAGYKRIGGVYTRPDCKGMGYEASLIYKMTEIIQNERFIPMLYSSDTKKLNRNMYTDMGYTRCGRIAICYL